MKKLETKDQETFFSICIPTYNRGNFLGSAIQSVINQNYSNYELIVCDNASTDSTAELVNSYNHPKIKYFRHENLISMYANHNRCLSYAKADWILFLHSDDEMISLNSAENLLRETDFQEAIYKPVAWSTDHPKNLKQQTFLKLFRDLNGFSPSGTIYSKNLLLKVGGFREENIIADWEIVLDACLIGYPVLEFEGNFVKTGFHRGQTTYEISKSGESHIAKTGCVKRTLSKIVDINDFIDDFVSTSSRKEIMLFYRYLKHGNLEEVAERLKRQSIQNQKFSYFNIDYFHSFLDDVLGLEKYLSLFRVIKKIEYALKR